MDKKLYVGSDSENLDSKKALLELGYDPNKFEISNVEDGFSGGGGDDSCFVTIKEKNPSAWIQYDDEKDDEYWENSNEPRHDPDDDWHWSDI
jgi:hypothetical protein